jgi:molybdate transport system permease protein
MPLVVLGGIAAALVILPLAGLMAKAPWSHLLGLLTAGPARSALWLSLVSSLAATALCVLLGLPLAWVQQRTRFPGRELLRALTTLPVVLPPVVGGVGLLLAFGRQGLLGQFLSRSLGVQVGFSLVGVILAETFVSMPFLVLAIGAALESADHRLEEAAQSLGASPWTLFWRVTLPLIRPSLAAGAVLSWARALGEFGATITFAGNFPGRTQTLPLAIYMGLETDPGSAIALSLILVALSLGVLIGMHRRWIRAL